MDSEKSMWNFRKSNFTARKLPARVVAVRDALSSSSGLSHLPMWIEWITTTCLVEQRWLACMLHIDTSHVRTARLLPSPRAAITGV